MELDLITTENFQEEETFDIEDVLVESVFYPVCGLDAYDIESLSPGIYRSFIHVNNTLLKEEVQTAMNRDFYHIGYDLIGIRDIEIQRLIQNGFKPHNFNPFVLWAVYQLNPARAGRMRGKLDRFSLLHIGGEACNVFNNIYMANQINPSVVAIINPGEGFGDNHLQYINPTGQLYSYITENACINNLSMPPVLLTNITSQNGRCIWPDYQYEADCGKYDPRNNHNENVFIKKYTLIN